MSVSPRQRIEALEKLAFRRSRPMTGTQIATEWLHCNLRGLPTDHIPPLPPPNAKEIEMAEWLRRHLEERNSE